MSSSQGLLPTTSRQLYFPPVHVPCLEAGKLQKSNSEWLQLLGPDGHGRETKERIPWVGGSEFARHAALMVFDGQGTNQEEKTSKIK